MNGSDDDQQDEEFALGFPENLDKAEEHEKIEGRIEEEAVALVEEIIEERFNPLDERQRQPGLFDRLGLFRRQRAFIDGEGRDRAVHRVNGE